MKPTPFDPRKDLAPIPFTSRVLELAQRMKQAGLTWSPHVGCFVWDRDDVIEVPSPFPENVYFILNLGRFLRIFETRERMVEKLVFVPTRYQARLILDKLGAGEEFRSDDSRMSKPGEGEADLIEVYEAVLKTLQKE